MNRRDFFKGFVLVACGGLAGTGKTEQAEPKAIAQIPRVQYGDMLSSSHMNSIVDAVNALSAERNGRVITLHGRAENPGTWTIGSE